jgi:hypothetical protein
MEERKENWYRVEKKEIIQRKGYNRIIECSNSSLLSFGALESSKLSIEDRAKELCDAYCRGDKSVIEQETDGEVLLRLYSLLPSMTPLIFQCFLNNPNFPVKKLEKILEDESVDTIQRETISLMIIKSGRVSLEVIEKKILSDPALEDIIAYNPGNIYLKRSILRNGRRFFSIIRILQDDKFPKEAKVAYLKSNITFVINKLDEYIEAYGSYSSISMMTSLKDIMPEKIIDVFFEKLEKKYQSGEWISLCREGVFKSLYGDEEFRDIFDKWIARHPEKKDSYPWIGRCQNKIANNTSIRDEIGKTSKESKDILAKINWYKGASKMSQLSEKPEEEIGSGEISATKLITLLHEIEYKNHLLNQVTENAIHPKRRENIQNRLGYFANRYFEYLKDFIIKGFNQWKDIHPIEDSEKWADMVMDTHENITNWNNFFEKYNMQWGGCELSLREIPLDKAVTKEYVLSLDQEEILYSMGLYFREKSINKEPSVDLIDDNFIEWHVENMGDGLYSHLIDERGIHYAIKEILYNSYMQVWGEDVRKIIANVNVAIKRLEDVSNKGEEASISEMTAAISLALNVQHVAGTIMVDFIPDDYIISNVNTDFLDDLSKLDVSNWEKEFHEEFCV